VAAAELIAWYSSGYFGAELPLRHTGAGEGASWRPLREVLPELKGETAAAVAKQQAPAGAATAPAPPVAPVAASEDSAPAQATESALAAEAEEENAQDCTWDAAARLRARGLFDVPGAQWAYIDPAGNTQGPFEGPAVWAWFLAGYLNERALRVAPCAAGVPPLPAFRPLHQLLEE